MKSKHFLMLASTLVLSITLSTGALAKEKKGRAADTQPAASGLDSYSTPPSSARFGLGVASAAGITGTDGALTGMLGLDEKNSIQFYFSLPSVSPFTFAMAGIFKHTIHEEAGAGFHIGGGLGLGVQGGGTAAAAANALANAFGGGAAGGGSSFMLSLKGVAGVHFPLTSSRNMMMHFDGGAGIALNNGSVGFAIDSLSPLMGASVLYFF